MGRVASKHAKVVTNTLGASHSQQHPNFGTLKKLGKLKASTRKMKTNPAVVKVDNKDDNQATYWIQNNEESTDTDTAGRILLHAVVPSYVDTCV